VADAGAKFKSLKDPWANTISPHGELMVTILAGVAASERHLIKARRVRFGRTPALTPDQRREAISG
jgi:DNA invertase Pin-like site-specific DNA recombinase